MKWNGIEWNETNWIIDYKNGRNEWNKTESMNGWMALTEQMNQIMKCMKWMNLMKFMKLMKEQNETKWMKWTEWMKWMNGWMK